MARQGERHGWWRIQNLRERFSLTSSLMFASGSLSCAKRLSCRFENNAKHWPGGGAPWMAANNAFSGLIKKSLAAVVW